MPYAPQIKVRDRWAIVAYIRALMRSQNANLERCPRGPAGGVEPMSHATPAGRTRDASPRQGARARRASCSRWRSWRGRPRATRWSVDPRRFAFSYLTAWMFVTSVSVGSLAWLMLHHLTGAVWSVVLRRLLENLTRPLPWIAVFFIPIALNLNRLYPWADPSRVSDRPRAGPQGGLAQPGLVHRAVGHLPGAVGAPGRAAGADIGPPGPDRRPSPDPPDAGDQRLGPGRAGVDDELRRVRLADVARCRTGRRRSSASTSGRARSSARSPR